MKTTKVAVMGASGYTALELFQILLRHPGVELTAATTRQKEPVPLTQLHPSLLGRTELQAECLSPAEIASRAEVVFTCLPHTASMEIIPELLDEGLTVIDLSADYRLKDPGVYETWYGHVHTDPTRLDRTVYGLPELFRDQIPGQKLIANPGCYTSTSILALAPLLKEKLIEPQGICIDAKSGVSGAGRAPKVATLYAECNESISPYAVGTHRHMPEIDQVLSVSSGQEVGVVFTPHLTPMDRGILASIYARPTAEVTTEQLLEVFRNHYADEPFMAIREDLPRTKDVSFTNNCHITVRVTRGVVQVFSVLDNLLKGASGVAVQNFNLLCDYEETTGLIG